MSPLWPDLALARAAWDDAVDKGRVDPTETRGAPRAANDDRYWGGRPGGEAVRRPIRRRVSSLAL
jgi:hypothetical protein